MDIDTTSRLDALLALKLNMYLGASLSSTYRTSNRMVLGQRLPSISDSFLSENWLKISLGSRVKHLKLSLRKIELLNTSIGNTYVITI
ncbi:hypothetical protein WAI453_013387 [Rhynchosporium graminicola]